jgi:UDP-N-acetylmuramoyl-tripeptide--D-alanyl-D-alanine ligase
LKHFFGRGEILDGEVTIYQDCYNANFDSVKSSLELFATTPWQTGAKIPVLGAMKELGDQTEALHGKVVEILKSMEFPQVFLLGEEFKAVADDFPQAQVFLDFDTLLDSLEGQVKSGDILLVKGSRSLEMERIGAHFTRGRA